MESLCTIIEAEDDPFVVFVDGKFGSGKTTFLKMYAAHLRLKKFEVVEFNAWQQSHTEDPLLDLTSALAQKVANIKTLQKVAAGIGWCLASVVTNGGVNRGNFSDSEDDPTLDLWDKIEHTANRFTMGYGKSFKTLPEDPTGAVNLWHLVPFRLLTQPPTLRASLAPPITPNSAVG